MVRRPRPQEAAFSQVILSGGRFNASADPPLKDTDIYRKFYINHKLKKAILFRCSTSKKKNKSENKKTGKNFN